MASKTRALIPNQVTAHHAEKEVEYECFWPEGSDRYWDAAVGSLLLAVYWRTSYRTVSGGDSGEIVFVACGRLVAHPPGYPLITLLNIVFHWIGALFWIRPAFASSLGSALLSAAACSLLSATVRSISLWSSLRMPGVGELEKSWTAHWAGLSAGLILGFSETFWLYAIQGEVFALNSFLIMLSVYTLTRFCLAAKLEMRVRCAQLGALLCGLCACNNHIAVFVLAPIVIGVLLKERSLFYPCNMLKLVVFLALGFYPYLYLPWVSSKYPFQSWGDHSTWRGFRDHFFRKQYGTFRLGVGEQTKDFSERLYYYLLDFLHEFTLVGVGLALVGLYGLFIRKQRFPLPWILLGSLTLHTLCFNYLANIGFDKEMYLGVQARFWMTGNLIVLVFMGTGIFFALETRNTIIYPRLLALTLPVYLLFSGFSYLDRSKSTFIQDYAEAVMSSFPNNSLALLKGDIWFTSTGYLQICEGFRTDLNLMELSQLASSWWVKTQAPTFRDRGLVIEPWGLHSNILAPDHMFYTSHKDIVKLVVDNVRGRWSLGAGVFLCGGIDDVLPLFDDFGFECRRYGFCWEVVRKNPNPTDKERIKIVERYRASTLAIPEQLWHSDYWSDDGIYARYKGRDWETHVYERTHWHIAQTLNLAANAALTGTTGIPLLKPAFEMYTDFLFNNKVISPTVIWTRHRDCLVLFGAVHLSAQEQEGLLTEKDQDLVKAQAQYCMGMHLITEDPLHDDVARVRLNDLNPFNTKYKM